MKRAVKKYVRKDEKNMFTPWKFWLSMDTG